MGSYGMIQYIYVNSILQYMFYYSKEKKSSLVFGNQPNEHFFYNSPDRIVDCVSEYLSLISKKQTNKEKKYKEYKKAKESIEEKGISLEN